MTDEIHDKIQNCKTDDPFVMLSIIDMLNIKVGELENKIERINLAMKSWESMKATNEKGHIWTGEKTDIKNENWWIYEDEKGNLYESRERPAYRIVMDRATLTSKGITPISCL